jgi:thiol-disulfide isomerase/thioredoxin
MYTLRLTCCVTLCFFATLVIAQDEVQKTDVTEAPVQTPSLIEDPFTSFDEDAVTNTKDAKEQSNATKPAQRAIGQKVDLQDDYEAALKLAQLEQRPLLVIFGADWCTWCRKLEKEFDAEEADAILKQWIVVKVDVDAEPELAQEMSASSLPGLRVLGTDQTVVASKEGYLPLAELHTWLDSSLAEADPTIQRVLFDSETIKESDLAKLIEFLGNKSPNLRNAAQRRLSSSRSVSAPVLVDTLRSGRLSQQLCALNILQSWQAPVSAIDPWQPDSIDAESVQPLIEWLRSLPTSDAEKPKAEIESMPIDEAAASACIEKLLNDNVGVRANLMAEATLLGKGLIPSIRMRIANGSELDDSQRITLRELLYRLLVGDKCRLENSSLLVALSSLRAETHRAAAEKLLALATSQDQPLVDELSVDVDPLVREMTVAKLQTLGALRDSEQVRKLLADKSPSVRTAVLRELTEHPQDKSTETLIAYIDRETDEDLLVYATKTLGQLGTATGAEDALCRLAKNDRWRVRAAALDAVEQSLEKNNRQSYGGDEDRGGASAPIAQAVITASNDTDAFVSAKAIALLPKILSKRSSEVIGEFLLEHPEQIRFIDKDVSEYQRDEKFAPLLGHAEKWLKSDDQKKISGATQLIAKLKPVLLRERIPSLLESKDSKIRIAAMSASIASLVQTRDEQLEAAMNLWQTRSEMVEVGDPWVEVPLALQSLPPAKNAKPAEANNEKASKATETVSGQSESTAALAVVDDFFGGSNSAAVEPEATKAEEQTEPTAKPDVSNLFGAVDDLFGAASTEDVPDDSIKKSANEKASNLKGFKKSPLASSWLSEWHNGQERKEIAWVKTLQTSLESVLGGDDKIPSESAWARAALLACGKSELSESIAEQISSEDTEAAKDAPNVTDVLPWMPAELRLAELKRSKIDWHDLKTAKVKSLLEAATVVDSLEIAEWIFQESSAAKLKVTDLALVHKSLIRALVGARADDIPTWGEGDTVKTFSKPLKQKPESVPGAKRAIDWLGDHYRSTQDDWSKALLLLTASHLDHSLATRSAVGIIANATEYTNEVRVALALALSDTSELSTDRAVQWLEHRLVEVKLACAKRLLIKSDDYARESMEIGASIVYESNAPIGLWEIRRDLPVESLRELSKIDKPKAWYVKLLLMSTGEEYALPEMLKEHGSKEDMLPVVAALAKAERTDEEALAYYTKAAETLTAYGEPAQLLTLLRGLDGKEIAELRRKLRAQDNSNGFPSF